MSSITITPAPQAPEVLDQEKLEQQVGRDLGRVSNLLGFTKQQREALLAATADHPALAAAWEDLQDAARRNAGSCPVWIRNKIVGHCCFQVLDEWLSVSDL